MSSSNGSSSLASNISEGNTALAVRASPNLSPTSTFSSLPATPGVGMAHRPLPDELDDMATQAIQSEDKMGVLKITGETVVGSLVISAELSISSQLVACLHTY